MTKVHGVGIMGCGNIAGAYLQLAPTFNNLEVRAVADLVPEAAQSRAAEYGVRAQTPDEMLTNDEIDVVVNLTIPAAHFGVSMDVLSAGKHVYSEKPFVLSVDEGRKLAAEARGRGLRIGSAPDTFLGSAHQQARALVDQGAIGKITSGTAHVMSYGAEHWHPNPGFFYLPGAGPVLDMGPYYVTELVHLLGPVRRVTAMSNIARHERVISSAPKAGEIIKVGTATTVHGIMEFVSGAVITLGASWDVRRHGHRNIELYGVDGTLVVPDPNFFAGALVLAGPDGKENAVAQWDHPFGVPNLRPRTDAALYANYRSAGLADLMDAADRGRTARCSFELALHTVDVLTSILAAADTATTIELTTTCERPEPLGPQAAAAMLGPRA